MKILITGGAGFIGSHIQDKLIKLNHKVGIIDNLRSGKKENLNKSAKFFNIDIRDKKSLEKIIKQFKPQAIFHLAAQNEVPYSMDHPFEDQEINILGMMNLLAACKSLKPKIIYSNTGGAFYGEVNLADLPIKEDHFASPTSFYGASKHSAEIYLRLYGNVYKIPWVALRYSNVYGPRQDGNKEAGIVAIFTQKLLKGEPPTINGDGSHSRDYVFVGDVVEANLKALNYKHNDFFNISTGVETTNNQVFKALESHLKTGLKPKHGPPRAGDPQRNSLSPKKANKLLKWKAKLDFKSGIKKTLDCYLKLSSSI